MIELLNTKLFIPRSRTNLVSRPHLVERLNAGLDKKLTLIAAPAGYTDKGMPRWAFQFYREFYRMTADEIKDIPETHRAYAGVTARVARDHKAILVDMQNYLARRAAQHGVKLSELVNELLRKDIDLIEAGK